MLKNGALSQALQTIAPTTWEGTAFRCVKGVSVEDVAGALRNLTKDGRYSREGAFRALYLSLSPELAKKEYRQSPSADEVRGVTCLDFPLRVERVLDLRGEAVQGRLGTNLQELTGDWQVLTGRGQDAPTQRLGRAAFESEHFDAILSPSKLDPEGTNLLVFVDRVGARLAATGLPAGFPERLEV
ncbi:RES family NAD+ phosphorylase [Deinococcus planocerae]|uniref:RES family NAD+ phosphorylase n=1 Tax=Deinococcus planocerae TaxID=1737569 RepID=UPI000C7E9562|nr:RES family NAD+ phosphorylase [Deinococcus planocerae]